MKKDINAAIDIVKDFSKCDDKGYLPIYRFTNENQDYLSDSSFVGDKKICTILSNGDQVFNMLLGGASSIKTFDINIFTKYYFYLKKASILAFSYDDFVNFYFRDGLFIHTLFSRNKYKVVREYIENDDALLFWDTLFNLYEGKSFYNSNLFMKSNYSLKKNQLHNTYLKHWTRYNELKDKLKNFELDFKHLDIIEDKDNIFGNDSYDLIYLSNIFDYVDCKDSDEYAKKVKDTFNKLFNNLSDDGKIICYLFNYLDDFDRGTLSSEVIRYKYFYGFFNYIRLDSFIVPDSNRIEDKDALLVYSKKRVLNNGRKGYF